MKLLLQRLLDNSELWLMSLLSSIKPLLKDAEFLNVTVSRSCDRAKFNEFVQILENSMHKLKYHAFKFICHTYYVILCVILALFLAQILKTKVLTAQKSLILECLKGWVSIKKSLSIGSQSR